MKHPVKIISLSIKRIKDESKKGFNRTKQNHNLSFLKSQRLAMLFGITLFLLSVSSGCEKKMDDLGNLVPKTVTDDSNLPQINVNGTLLHAETFGDINNPILIFNHGGPGSDYRPMISEFGVENASRYPNERTLENAGLTRLQDEYFCVFFDQRGAGLSTRYERGIMDFDMYIADLNAVVDHYVQKKYEQTGIWDDQINLLGWSFGGILCTGYINAHPEKVKDVVFYEPGPFSKESWTYFKEHSTGVFQQLGEEWLEELLQSKTHISGDSHERADYQLTTGAFRAQPELNEHPETPAWRLGAFLRTDNLDNATSESYDITSNIMNAFNGRSLFVNGSKTAIEYPEYSAMQQTYYPQSEYVEIQGTGHTGPWEKPSELSQIIREFLD